MHAPPLLLAGTTHVLQLHLHAHPEEGALLNPQLRVGPRSLLEGEGEGEGEEVVLSLPPSVPPGPPLTLRLAVHAPSDGLRPLLLHLKYQRALGGPLCHLTSQAELRFVRALHASLEAGGGAGGMLRLTLRNVAPVALELLGHALDQEGGEVAPLPTPLLRGTHLGVGEALSLLLPPCPLPLVPILVLFRVWDAPLTTPLRFTSSLRPALPRPAILARLVCPPSAPLGLPLLLTWQLEEGAKGLGVKGGLAWRVFAHEGWLVLGATGGRLEGVPSLVRIRALPLVPGALPPPALRLSLTGADPRPLALHVFGDLVHVLVAPPPALTSACAKIELSDKRRRTLFPLPATPGEGAKGQDRIPPDTRVRLS